MNRINTPLAQLLKTRIKAHGPMTFRDIMEQALFHPELGFYSKGPGIGIPEGTFNTSAMFPLFASCLARAIEEADSRVGEKLRIVELGGGTGELGARILSCLSCYHDYVVVDPSPGLRHQQEALGLQVVARIEDINPAPSFVFANEVLDALPVHRVLGDGEGNMTEMYVGLDPQGEFREEFYDISTPQLQERVDTEHVLLGRGQLADICLAYDPFFRGVASVMPKGYVVVIDYGDEAPALYHYSRRNGTLRCYYQQRQVFDPFDRLGEQDITADVDFTAVRKAAELAGFQFEGRLSQGNWLNNLGIHDLPFSRQMTQAQWQEIEQLTNPARLGGTFDVLAWKTQDLPPFPGFL